MLDQGGKYAPSQLHAGRTAAFGVVHELAGFAEAAITGGFPVLAMDLLGRVEAGQ